MKVVKKHPLAIRWFHWVNFPLITIMIWSGMLIYWANDVYSIRLATVTLFRFFPPGFYNTLNIPYHLAEGMAFHFVFMWGFFLNGLAYLLFTIFSGEWRWLLPKKSSFKEAWHVFLHDLHLRKKAPPIEGKYNAAQRIAYTAIIIMGFGSIITGLSIYKPVQFGWLTAICGGYEWARAEHFILTMGYVLFFIIHIAQVIKTGWNNFQAMITGFEIVRKKEEPVKLPSDEKENQEESQGPNPTPTSAPGQP